MTMTVGQAIHFLQAKGFLVKGYGFPESDTLHDAESLAEHYRVLQGDYDTGMIAPMQLLEVAQSMRLE